MIRMVALISIKVPMNRNSRLIMSRNPALLAMFSVIRVERKFEMPARVMTFPATAEKALRRPMVAVEAPAMAQHFQKVTLMRLAVNQSEGEEIEDAVYAADGAGLGDSAETARRSSHR